VSWVWVPRAVLGLRQVGAFGGAVIVALVLHSSGVRAVTLIGFCCYTAGILTTLLIREPHGRALDDISNDLTA
jgi:predicted MFS family arabinose efflux permease